MLTIAIQKASPLINYFDPTRISVASLIFSLSLHTLQAANSEILFFFPVWITIRSLNYFIRFLILLMLIPTKEFNTIPLDFYAIRVLFFLLLILVLYLLRV